MVLEDHPVRVAVGRPALEVGDLGGGSVGHPPSGPAEAPAQVDVLGVHEVRLVEAPTASNAARRTRKQAPETQSTGSVVPAAAVQLAPLVAAGEPVVGRRRARAGRARRHRRSTGTAGPTDSGRPPGCGSGGRPARSRGRHRGRPPGRPRRPAAPRGPGCRPGRSGGPAGGDAPVDGRPVPEVLARGRPRWTSGTGRPRRASEPSADPLSTTTRSASPHVARSPTQRGQGVPDS